MLHNRNDFRNKHITVYIAYIYNRFTLDEMLRYLPCFAFFQEPKFQLQSILQAISRYLSCSRQTLRNKYRIIKTENHTEKL